MDRPDSRSTAVDWLGSSAGRGGFASMGELGGFGSGPNYGLLRPTRKTTKIINIGGADSSTSKPTLIPLALCQRIGLLKKKR